MKKITLEFSKACPPYKLQDTWDVELNTGYILGIPTGYILFSDEDFFKANKIYKALTKAYKTKKFKTICEIKDYIKSL